MAHRVRRLAGRPLPGVLNGHDQRRARPADRAPHDRATDRAPARLTINIVEGRGIWVDLEGSWIDGALERVVHRLDRLARLRFEVVVISASGIDELDSDGTQTIAGFVDRVADGRGVVLLVDPEGRVRHAADRLRRATISRVPPDGAWWLR